MKHIHLLAGMAAALVLVACGGSNSSNSGSSNPVGTPPIAPGTPRIEAVVLTPTTFDNGSQSKGQTFVIQDPNDIEAQDQVQFQLVTYSPSGVRTVLPTNQWTISDKSGTSGQITFNNGVFIASKAETQVPQVVSVVLNGKIISASYQVLPRQVRLRGVLLSDSTHQPISGVEIDFYGPANPTVSGSPEVFEGRVVTAFDGSFRASVPEGTTGFTLVNDTLPAGYQRFFRFDGEFHATGDTNCLALLKPPVTVLSGPNQATDATSTTLTDTSLNLSLNQYAANSLQIVSDATVPAAAGEFGVIQSNTGNDPDANNDPVDTFTLVNPWRVTPDANAIFNIVNQDYVDGEHFLIDYSNPNLNTNGTILLVPSTEPAPTPTCGN